MSLVLTWESANNTTSDPGSTYTFTAQTIGTAASDRVVIVYGTSHSGSPGTFAVSTIGGVTASVAVTEATTANDMCGIWYAAVPTGTTADIVCTGSGISTIGISVYQMTGGNATPTATNKIAFGFNGSPIAFPTITVPTGGVAIAGLYGGSSWGAGTWSNATLDVNNTTGVNFTTAHATVTAAPTFTGVSQYSDGVEAAWGPSGGSSPPIQPQTQIVSSQLTTGLTWTQTPSTIPPPNKPLNQTNWPNPVLLPYFDRSWVCYQPSNTLPPIGFPFNQRDWPLPVQPYKLDIQTWIESGNGFPPFPVQGFNQKDWPNPRTYSPIEQTWIHSSFPATIPPPNKPFNTTDWPLPVQPSRLDAIWTETGNAYYAVPRPFVQSNWPLTPAYTPIDPTWIVEGIGGGVIQPFSQTDWPLTGRYYTPDSTWTFFNDALYSAPVIPVPKNQYDWQLPTQPYRQEYTWIVTPKVIPPPNRPFNQTDWPVPPAPPRLDATWKLGLIPNTVPFNQYTWPNPGAYPRPDETWIGTHVFTPTAQIPFNQYDWPVPNGYPRLDETYVFFNPNTQQVLVVPLPLIKQFTDLTLPLPYRIDASWINQIPQLTPVPPAPVQPQGGGIYPSEWWDAYANLIKHPKSPTVVPSHSEEVKNAAATLSKMGGHARAASLTAKQRSTIASQAAQARWNPTKK